MLPLKCTTVDKELRRSVAQHAENIALSFEDEYWTYNDFNRQVNNFSHRFLSLGIKKGTKVGVLCEAEPNTLFSMFALSRIGAIPVMFNTSLKRNELKILLANTDTEILLIGDGYREIDYRDECKGFCEELPKLHKILYIGLSGDAKGYTPLADVPLGDDGLTVEEVLPGDESYILFTSGTTDVPKAVVTTQYSRVNSGLQQAADQGMTEKDKTLVAMPIFHCFCLSVNIMATLFSGGQICLPPSRHTEDLLKTIEKEKVTVFSSVPALFHAMLCRDDFDEWDTGSLRIGFIGGSLYPPQLFKEIESRFGFTLLSSLGQTEATSGITTCYPDDDIAIRSTTVGHFMNHVEHCIKNNEVCVRGYVVMKGYYGNPEATAKAIDEDGWLHTGDCGYMDENDNLILTGRVKDFIIRGGENISSREIENVCMAFNGFEECKAIGVPDEHYGEQVCLCIVKKEGCSLTEEDIGEMFASNVAHYKVPEYILFFDSFPKSLTGKIKVGELKDKAVERLSHQ